MPLHPTVSCLLAILLLKDQRAALKLVTAVHASPPPCHNSSVSSSACHDMLGNIRAIKENQAQGINNDPKYGIPQKLCVYDSIYICHGH